MCEGYIAFSWFNVVKIIHTPGFPSTPDSLPRQLQLYCLYSPFKAVNGVCRPFLAKARVASGDGAGAAASDLHPSAAALQPPRLHVLHPLRLHQRHRLLLHHGTLCPLQRILWLYLHDLRAHVSGDVL